MRRTLSFNRPTLLLCLAIQILVSLVLWLFFLSIATEAQAAVTTSISPTGGTGNPASLGTVITSGASTVPTNMCSANCVITGGTRAGSNLFHSFGDFSIGTLDGARFQTGLVNPVPDASVANILGRVTGGNPSNIFGTLNSATYYPSANLFLMNPAGIVFGPSAVLNVGGAVTFTTANYLRLGDGKLFNAIPDATADALLSAAPVAAFGFLGSNAEAITVQGSQLSVTPGQSLSLVGGNITIQSGTPDGGTVQSAKLSAPGGQINLASVASPGEILTGTMEKAPNINGQSFGALGTIQVLEQSVIDVSGNGGGTVLIRGGQLLLDNSTISANVTGPGPVIDGTESIGRGIDIQVSQDALIQNGALIDTSVVGNATPGVQYGGVHVKGDHIEVRGIADFDTGNFVFTTIQANVGETIVGNSGNITLEGNSILVKDAGQIQTVTNGAGNAGNITLKANQSLDIDTALVQSAAQQTFDAAGNIKTRATGDSGNIELASAHGNISLINGSSVTSQTVESPGTAGNIDMNAPEGNVLMADSGFFTYIQPPINAQGVRAMRAEGSGEVRINANNMQMNGGTIDVINLSAQPAGEVTVTIAGKFSLSAGTFTPSHIRARSVGLLDGSIGGAPSAGLNVKAHDIIISDGSSISTDTNGPGAAGPLNISAVNLQLANGGTISSSSIQGVDLNGLPGPPPSGSAGNITIQGLAGPVQSVLIDGTGSGILTNTVGTGEGGSINITAHSLTVQNGGTLSAATSGIAPSATGGTITVKADTVTLNTGGTMTAASTGPGASGEVVVQGFESPAQSILIDGVESGIFTDTHGTGAGGDIHLSSNSVTLQNGGTLSATTSGTSPSAIGGSISVNATDGVTMTNGGSITASSTGPGDAGNISINAGQQLQMQNSSITTTASQASGGNIEIQAIDQVRLVNSTISTSVLGGTGSGGNITIDPNSVILQNSQIIAQAIQGAGGNITIVTPLFLADQTSIVDASSEFGLSGTVNIQNPTSNLAGSIASLPSSLRQTQTLQTGRCAALHGEGSSSFIVAGRETIPTEPGGWEVSPMASLNTGPGLAVRGDGQEMAISARVPEDQEVVSLRRLTPAGFLTQHFAENPATGCRS